MKVFEITKMGKGEITDCFTTNTNVIEFNLGDDISQEDFYDHYIFRIRPVLDKSHEIFIQFDEESVLKLGFGWKEN